MKNTSKKQANAFTLVEIMVAVSIMGLLFTVVMFSYTSFLKLFYFNTLLNVSHSQVKNAADRIANDIRQSICYPVVYDSQGNQLPPGQAGSEVRIIREGIYTFTTAFTSNGATLITVNKPIDGADSATKPLVTGILPQNLNTVVGQPIKQNVTVRQITAGDAIQFDTTAMETLLITNATASGTVYNLTLNQPTSQTIGDLTRVAIGQMQIYRAVNWYTNYTTGESRLLSAGPAAGYTLSGELRHIPVASNTNDYRVLVPNLSTTNLFVRNSSHCAVDIKYTSKGDITGKGIYRILTHATMRSDPAYMFTSKTAVGGLHGMPSGGADDDMNDYAF